MANPLDPDDDMQRMVLRKAEATAKGGHAIQRLLTLTETRDSGQVRRVALFIAATYNGEAFPIDLFELRAVDEAISNDMLSTFTNLDGNEGAQQSFSAMGRAELPSSNALKFSSAKSIRSRELSGTVYAFRSKRVRVSPLKSRFSCWFKLGAAIETFQPAIINLDHQSIEFDDHTHEGRTMGRGRSDLRRPARTGCGIRTRATRSLEGCQ